MRRSRTDGLLRHPATSHPSIFESFPLLRGGGP